MEAAEQKPVSTRRVKLVEDRDALEVRRLQKRSGGFYQYVDSAEIFKPDRASTHFVDEGERFNKDFSIHDQGIRAVVIDK